MKSQVVKLKQGLNTFYAVDDTQFILELLPNTSESSFELVFDKEGVSAEILALKVLEVGEKFNLQTSAIHNVPNTSCVTKVKTVLENDSHSNYTGKIIIKPNAQQTSSFLNHYALVLGESVHNNSVPMLEIEANDVKASHGATTGRVDESQLYYLSSRGLSKSEATSLIVNGFLAELVEQIKDANIKEEYEKRFSNF